MAEPTASEQEADPTPLVARSGQGAPIWLLIGIAVVAALLLFALLNARRQRLAVPTATAHTIDGADASVTLPSLDLPPEDTSEPASPVAQPSSLPPPQLFLDQQRGVARLIQPLATNTSPRATGLSGSFSSSGPGEANKPVVASRSAVVVDSSPPSDAATNGRGLNQTGSGGGPLESGGRVRASMLANRATTVPQGTLIPAVLESGFDSTRPGFARALVQRNVASFDGQHTLIPRGSRLIGEYQSDNRPGQNRALIIWSRLIRPDGATIEIGSPVADTVGRGGVKAKVNSHFLTRFSGAILQSALNAGVNIASQAAGGAVVLALPNTASAAGNLSQPNTAVQPTLKVKPGTSISVFVAHDLDFTDVESP